MRSKVKSLQLAKCSSCFQLKGVNRLMLNTERPSLQVGEKTVTRSGLQDTFFGELQVNYLEDAIPPNNVGVSGQEQYIAQF